MEQDILKIVVTGPESSGKTLLANDLARKLQLFCVPEFARYYVMHLGRPYIHQDLSTIYAGQQLWEKWWLQQIEARYALVTSPTLPALVCDTDWTVIRIWEKYGYTTSSVLPVFDAWEWEGDTFYLLCSPDFPWQPDPIREHPEERWPLFDLYQQLLIERQLPHLVLHGNHADRLHLAMTEIQKLLRP